MGTKSIILFVVSKISAVIFDYGMVLAMPDANDWARMQKLLGRTDPAFSELYWKTRAEYDRSDLTEAEYWQDVAARGGITVTSETIAELNQADADHWTHVVPEMSALVRALQLAGLKTAILSNMPHYLSLRTIEKFREEPWFRELDARVFSCDLRSCKPDPEMYEEVLRKLACLSEESLFVDDIQKNVDGARQLGMHAVLFTSPQQLKRDLRDYLPDLEA